MPHAFSVPVLRGALVPLAAIILATGCGGDDDGDRAAAPAPAPAQTTTAPAETAPPAATEAAPPAETTPPATTPPETQPKAETTPAPAAGGSGTDGATEAAAANLRAQMAGDYETVKRLASDQCDDQVTKTSVEQTAAAFKTITKNPEQRQLKSLLDRLSRADGWKATAAGDGVAKVTAREKMGFADLYYVRQDGEWRDDTCARQPGASTTQGA